MAVPGVGSITPAAQQDQGLELLVPCRRTAHASSSPPRADDRGSAQWQESGKLKKSVQNLERETLRCLKTPVLGFLPLLPFVPPKLLPHIPYATSNVSHRINHRDG